MSAKTPAIASISQYDATGPVARRGKSMQPPPRKRILCPISSENSESVCCVPSHSPHSAPNLSINLNGASSCDLVQFSAVTPTSRSSTLTVPSSFLNGKWNLPPTTISQCVDTFPSPRDSKAGAIDICPKLCFVAPCCIKPAHFALPPFQVSS